jgi:hypothetical protein
MPVFGKALHERAATLVICIAADEVSDEEVGIDVETTR